MKNRHSVLVAISLIVLAGCASAPETAEIRVQPGMSRDELRRYFGEPLRTEPAAAGGENWYYRFVSWKTQPVGESGSRQEFGATTSYVTVGLAFDRNTEECPVHVSPAGYVTEPLPKGKVVKN